MQWFWLWSGRSTEVPCGEEALASAVTAVWQELAGVARPWRNQVVPAIFPAIVAGNLFSVYLNFGYTIKQMAFASSPLRPESMDEVG